MDTMTQFSVKYKTNLNRANQKSDKAINKKPYKEEGKIKRIWNTKDT